MTETQVPPTGIDLGLEHVTPLVVATRLRNVLRLNAVVSGLSGVVAALAARPLDGLLGMSDVPVRVVGIGLVLFAVAVGWVGSCRHGVLVAGSRMIGVADVLWVAATIVVIAAGAFSAAGVGVAVGVGLVVATFALLELSTARTVATQPEPAIPQPPMEAITLSRTVAAPAGQVWPVVSDHELYGVLAPNLGRVEVVSEDGPGLSRRCYDNRGRGWTETCTLWDDGRRFAVAVDTSDYPYPLAVMRGSWWVEAVDPGRSRIGMTFLFQPRPGLRGWLFAWVMQAGFPVVLRRILRGWCDAIRAG